MPEDAGYALIEVAGGRRLERFGARIVDRPLPGIEGAPATRGRSRRADLHYERETGWSGPAADLGPWPIELDGLRMRLRPTDAGQVGLFPEHLAMLPWLRAQGATQILHLFAYTGFLTLGLARAGASVTHVDASRPTVAWARQNAADSGLTEARVRWIVDDAVAFVAREVRRGRRYDGLVLDPPSYGHGPGGRAWTMEALPGMLETCRQVLEPGGFALLTAHTPGYDPERLAGLLDDHLGVGARGSLEAGDLEIRALDGEALLLGAFARRSRTA